MKLTKIIHNAFCFFGFHSWIVDKRFHPEDTRYPARQICSNCRAERLVIWCVYADEHAEDRSARTKRIR